MPYQERHVENLATTATAAADAAEAGNRKFLMLLTGLLVLAIAVAALLVFV